MKIIVILIILLISLIHLLLIKSVFNLEFLNNLDSTDNYELIKSYYEINRKKKRKFKMILISSILINLVSIFVFATLWMIIFYNTSNYILYGELILFTPEGFPWLASGIFLGISTSCIFIFGLLKLVLKEDFSYFMIFYNETYRLYGANTIGSIKILLYLTVIISTIISSLVIFVL